MTQRLLRARSQHRAAPKSADGSTPEAAVACAGAPTGDRGSAVIWVLAAVALLGLVGFAVVLRTAAVLARHRAQDAADLTALAAADGIGTTAAPCEQARAVATANHVRLVDCALTLTGDGRRGEVRVAVDSAVNLPLLGPDQLTVSARAARDPPR